MKTYVVGTDKKHLTDNICFHEIITKIILQILPLSGAMFI